MFSFLNLNLTFLYALDDSKELIAIAFK